jgi:DMSO/TMAO reductase YedYZ heme-binding membrane subunit
MRRIRRHVLIALLSCTLVLLGEHYFLYEESWERISVASAWVSMFLLSGALLIGPVYRLDGSPEQINIHLRRDVGIWAALNGLLHFVAGTVVAMDQAYISSFVSTAVAPLSVAVREQLFNGGSILGTVVALLFLMLLLISSDWAVRRIGAVRWKRLQRTATISLWLTVLHAIAFQLLEARLFPLLLTLMAIVAVVAFRLRAGLKAKQR